MPLPRTAARPPLMLLALPLLLAAGFAASRALPALATATLKPTPLLRWVQAAFPGQAAAPSAPALPLPANGEALLRKLQDALAPVRH